MAPKPPGKVLTHPIWKDDRRLQEAATVGFRSMKRGRDQGTDALHLLQSALIALEGQPAWYDETVDDAGNLTQVPTALFGPYAWGNEDTGPGACYFGPNTENAVKDFQSKIGGGLLAVDGIAGMQTLQAMDFQLNWHLGG
jgi:hypothetical protein